VIGPWEGIEGPDRRGWPKKRLIIGQTDGAIAAERGVVALTRRDAGCGPWEPEVRLRLFALGRVAVRSRRVRRCGRFLLLLTLIASKPSRKPFSTPQGQKRIHAVSSCETDQPFGWIHYNQAHSSRDRGPLPRKQHRNRRRIESLERRAIHFSRARGNPRQPCIERTPRALVRKRCSSLEATHDVFPFASCWLRWVRNCTRPATPCCWICSLNCC
jgi:hypothetical protein